MTRDAFILATGADTGGAAIRVVSAFNEQMPGPRGNDPLDPDWIVHSMVANTNYIEYDQDLPYSAEALEHYYDKADVVVLNNTLAGYHYYDGGQGKPTILMHHGLHKDHFAQTIEECVAEAREIGASQIASTVNLELYGQPGEISWAPIPYDVRGLLDMRKRLFQPSDTLRIGHAPTDRTVKSTEAVISAVETLQKRGYPVELVLIEHQTHAKTLETKAKLVDIYVDQLKLGYGCNAIEAWGMDIPVIAGVSAYPEWRAHMVRRFAGSDLSELPFMEANEENLVQTLQDLVGSTFYREKWSTIGRVHALRFHDDAKVVPLLAYIYDRAADRPTRAQPYGGLRSRRTDRTVRGMDHNQRLAMLREAEAQRTAAKKASY